MARAPAKAQVLRTQCSHAQPPECRASAQSQRTKAREKCKTDAIFLGGQAPEEDGVVGDNEHGLQDRDESTREGAGTENCSTIASVHTAAIVRRILPGSQRKSWPKLASTFSASAMPLSM